MSIQDLTDFERSAVIIGVSKLITGRNFNVCDFDSLAKIVGVTVTSKDYEPLRIMHCVNYADMGEHIAMQVKARAIELLGLKPADIEITPEPKPAEVVRPRLGFWSKK